MLLALIALPVLAAAWPSALPSDRVRPSCCRWPAPVHLALTVGRSQPTCRARAEAGSRSTRPAGSCCCCSACCSCLRGLRGRLPALPRRALQPGLLPCLLVFLGTMSLVACSQHLGLMWVAIEATHARHGAADLLQPHAALDRGDLEVPADLVGRHRARTARLVLPRLRRRCGGASPRCCSAICSGARRTLSRPWLHAGFVLLLVGYGTKMGLAPMHTWKPDAYGEAPGVVGAMLAGGLTSCAFLALLRVYPDLRGGRRRRLRQPLAGLHRALLSMGVAAVFMVGQRDLKRMLAYSSVEHMGILALGVGLGGPASFATLLHLVNNGLSKGGALPRRRQHPPRLRQQDHRRGARCAAPAARSPGRSSCSASSRSPARRRSDPS